MLDKNLEKDLKEFLDIDFRLLTKGDDYTHLKGIIKGHDEFSDLSIVIESDGDEVVDSLLADRTWVSRITHGLDVGFELHTISRKFEKGRVTLGLLDLSRD